MPTLLSSAGKTTLGQVLGNYPIQYQNKDRGITNSSSSPATVSDGKIAFPRDISINQKRSEINLGPVIKNGDYFQLSGLVTFDKVPTFAGWASQTKYEVSLNIGGNTVGGLRFDNQKLFIFGSSVTVPIQAGIPIAYVINFSRRNGRFFVSGRLNSKQVPEFTANDAGSPSIGHVAKFGAYGGVPKFNHTIFHEDVKAIRETTPIGMPAQSTASPGPEATEISEIDQLKVDLANLGESFSEEMATMQTELDKLLTRIAGFEETTNMGMANLQSEIDKIRSGLWTTVRENQAAIAELQSR